MQKNCSKCGKLKDFSLFAKSRKEKYGLCNSCKECQAKFRQANRERIRQMDRDGYRRNRELRIKKVREYASRNRGKILQQHAAYYRANRESFIQKTSAYKTKRRKTDLLFRLRDNLRARLGVSLRNHLIDVKKASSVRDLGCSVAELKVHLEKQFQPGMSWDNWGAWHIDHKKPLASFDLTDREQLLSAVHFSNLQPLWSLDNIRKGARAA